jgi:hypothetical protein
MSARLRLERLEDRDVPATITVTNLNDSGANSLRAAITIANLDAPVDDIVFDSSLFGGKITLTSNLPQFTQSANIIGPGSAANAIVIDGNSSFRTIDVAAGRTVSLSNLTLTRAFATTSGGAITNAVTMTLTNVDIANSQASGLTTNGGAILSAAGATMTLRN